MISSPAATSLANLVGSVENNLGNLVSLASFFARRNINTTALYTNRKEADVAQGAQRLTYQPAGFRPWLFSRAYVAP
jgi:hypothetical protein